MDIPCQQTRAQPGERGQGAVHSDERRVDQRCLAWLDGVMDARGREPLCHPQPIPALGVAEPRGQAERLVAPALAPVRGRCCPRRP